MALLDFLKNKEANEKSRQPAKAAAPALAAKKSAKKTTAKKEGAAKPVAAKPAATQPVVVTGAPVGLLKAPHISEKASLLAERNQYVFKVMNETNKTEVKKMIEAKYKVDVIGMNIINIHPKKRRLGKTQGFKKAFKKAIVTVKAGQKIEIV
jgi:large subunit ribosomal protein L23